MSRSAPSRLERNAILAQLPPGELQAMRRQLEVMNVEIRERVYEPGSTIPYVFFPIDAVFSIVAIADRRIAVEVETVGREGMVGLPLFLGASKSPHATPVSPRV